MSCVWMLQRGHSGDGCVLALTLCKYDLFVLSWARVRRVRRESISSELLVCGGGLHSILLLPLVARCLETIDVCIWRMFVFIKKEGYVSVFWLWWCGWCWRRVVGLGQGGWCYVCVCCESVFSV